MRHLDQSGLAERWRVSMRTLEQWRWQGKGPRYLKIGGRVVYRVEDVEAFEVANFTSVRSARLTNGTCRRRPLIIARTGRFDMRSTSRAAGVAMVLLGEPNFLLFSKRELHRKGSLAC